MNKSITFLVVVLLGITMLYGVNAVAPPSIFASGFTSQIGSGPLNDIPTSGGSYYLTTDNNAVTEYLLQYKTGSSATNLADGTYELYLTAISGTTRDNLKTYYDNRFTDPSLSAFLTYLKNAADGSSAFAYVKITGSNVMLLDGARHFLLSSDVDMAIPGDYPEGVYTVSGNVNINGGGLYPVTYVIIIDRTAPGLNVAGFTADSVSMSGSVSGGYTLNTNNNPSTSHSVQFVSGSVALENLKTETVGLYLSPTAGQTAALQTYYLTKPAPYQSYLNAAAAGAQPFAYIKTGGTAIQILDGAQKTLASVETDMIIPDNYPLGTYTVSGVIHDVAGNPTTVTYILIVAGDRTAPVIEGVSDIVAEATSSSGATVTIIPPISHDAVDGDLPALCDHSTGVFPLGITTVTCTKTDAAGNVATPITFTVTVQDTTSPTLDSVGFAADGDSMSGNIDDGFALETNNVASTHHQISFSAGTVSSEPLKNDKFALYLTGASTATKTILKNYYDERTEISGTPFLTYLKDAVDGSHPFAYIKGDGSTTNVQLLDAAKTDIFATPTLNMDIPDDYPLGTYIVSGQIKDVAGNARTVTFKLIVAGDRTINVNSSDTDIVVAAGHPIGNINVTQDVPDDTQVTLDLSAVVTDTGTEKTVTLPNDLTLSRDTSTIDYSVTLPTGTIISGPTGWTGIINVPTVKAITSVTPTTDTGMTNTVSTVIEVGFGDTPLTFDHAARLVITGQAGKLVGYSRSGVFYKITDVCSADTQVAGDALSAGSDCKIDVGSDLVIWTKHFTTFATYTQSATPTPTTTTTTYSGTSSTYTCGAWSSCVNGKMSRDCVTGTSKYTVTNDCTGTTTAPTIPTTPTTTSPHVADKLVPLTPAATGTKPAADKSASGITGQAINPPASAGAGWGTIVAIILGIVVIAGLVYMYYVKKPKA